jgi:hypothetical protein
VRGARGGAHDASYQCAAILTFDDLSLVLLFTVTDATSALESSSMPTHAYWRWRTPLMLMLDARPALASSIQIWACANWRATVRLRWEWGDAHFEQLMWMADTAFDLPKGMQHGETMAPTTLTAMKSKSVEQHRREDLGGAAWRCWRRWGREVSRVLGPWEVRAMAAVGAEPNGRVSSTGVVKVPFTTALSAFSFALGIESSLGKNFHSSLKEKGRRAF